MSGVTRSKAIAAILVLQLGAAIGHAAAQDAESFVPPRPTGYVSDFASVLDAVEPVWATLSCGVRNRFGHPHVPVLERLARRGIVAVRLDRSGGFTWATDGNAESVRTATRAR